MPSSEDAEAMTAYITGLVAGSLRLDSLTEPVHYERVEIGVLQIRLASGMLATISVKVEL